MNQTIYVRNFLEILLRKGVKSFVVCPGARSSAFVAELSHQPKLNVYWGFEERAAAFFALGISRREGRPAAVITTSGTAAGELLPAAMEASFLGVPLVLVTCDRPKRMRLTGAPQTAFQPHLFGIYAPCICDLSEGEEFVWKEDITGPSHLNICLEEPDRKAAPSEVILFPRDLPIQKEKKLATQPFLDFVAKKRPLAIVSALSKAARDPVARFLEKSKIPVYIEAPSGLREKVPSLQNPDLLSCDAIVRIGGIPTTRLWRDLEESSHSIFSITEKPFPGLTRGQMTVGPIAHFFNQLETVPLFSHKVKEKALAPFTEEERFIERLSCKIPEGSLVYLGNSLPIRHWDRAATRNNQALEIHASRGLNGIDGQVATFLGLAEEGKENWAILGDLTFLYDMSAPWFLKERPHLNIVLVIINNRGGRIFDRLFSLPKMVNEHALSFKPIADFWGFDYLLWKGEKIPPRSGPLLVEILL